MPIVTRNLVVAILPITFIACGRSGSDRTALGVVGRTNAHVTLAADGDRVAAVWGASGAGGVDVEFALSVDGGRRFTAPVRVNDVAGEASVSGEQPPRVVVHGHRVDVIWVAKRDGVAAIRAATSNDEGQTFSSARTITPEGIGGARGWESASLDADGSVHAVWLDGRAALPQAPMIHTAASSADSGEHHHHMSPRQDVFHAVWRGAGAPTETRVATNVCFCCKTAIVTRGNDVFVAWRHLFDGGVRDIAIARSADGGRTFGDPVRASADNWKIDACPDDGPALAVDARDVLHVTWPTLIHEGGRDRMAIFHATSNDGGVTFSPRERVDQAVDASASHPKIAAGADGTVAIVWDQQAAGSRTSVGRILGNSGVVLGSEAASSYPAVAATRGGYVTGWTEQDASSSRVMIRRGF